MEGKIDLLEEHISDLRERVARMEGKLNNGNSFKLKDSGIVAGISLGAIAVISILQNIQKIMGK